MDLKALTLITFFSLSLSHFTWAASDLTKVKKVERFILEIKKQRRQNYKIAQQNRQIIDSKTDETVNCTNLTSKKFLKYCEEILLARKTNSRLLALEREAESLFKVLKVENRIPRESYEISDVIVASAEPVSVEGKIGKVKTDYADILKYEESLRKIKAKIKEGP